MKISVTYIALITSKEDNETMKDEKHFLGKIHQNAVITTKDRKVVLLVRDVGDPTMWQLPGGRLNEGEEPVDGFRRELREELGIEVEVGSIFHTQQIWHIREQRNNFLIVYEVFVESKDVKFILEPTEIAEVQWVTRETYKSVEMFDDTRTSLDVYFLLPLQ